MKITTSLPPNYSCPIAQLQPGDIFHLMNTPLGAAIISNSLYMRTADTPPGQCINLATAKLETFATSLCVVRHTATLNIDS